jgi:predicted MFS family arabinose efflux permease
MTVSNVRSALAILIVGVFMGITAFMAVFPLITPAQVDLSQYSDFFAKTASVYTGMVGVVIGYYFGRSSEPKSKEAAIEPDRPSETKS